MPSPDSKPTPSSQSLATLSGQENDGRLSDAEVRAFFASAIEMIEKRDRQLDESARKLFETRSENAELKMATMVSLTAMPPPPARAPLHSYLLTYFLTL